MVRYSSRLDVMDAVDSDKLARCQTQGPRLVGWANLPLTVENGIGIVEERQILVQESVFPPEQRDVQVRSVESAMTSQHVAARRNMNQQSGCG